MLHPVRYDAHLNSINWSARPMFGKHSLMKGAATFVSNTYHPIIAVSRTAGIKSIEVTTNEDVTGATLSFALVGERGVIVDSVLADVDIAKAVAEATLQWGAMFAKGSPAFFTFGELEPLFPNFAKDTDWNSLYLAFKLHGAVAPDSFNVSFVLEGFGRTSS